MWNNVYHSKCPWGKRAIVAPDSNKIQWQKLKIKRRSCKHTQLAFSVLEHEWKYGKVWISIQRVNKISTVVKVHKNTYTKNDKIEIWKYRKTRHKCNIKKFIITKRNVQLLATIIYPEQTEFTSSHIKESAYYIKQLYNL